MNRPFRPLVGLLLAALVVACGAHDESGKTPNGSSAQGEPRRGGTLVTGWTTEPLGVNELLFSSTTVSNEVLFQTFQHLFQEEPDFTKGPPRFRPELAASMGEWSNDHKTLTLPLRKGLVWSDGDPLNAHDVRFTWEAQKHPDVAWGKAFMKEAIRDVEVVDDWTVRFHFTHAYAEPKQLLDINEGVILPEHRWGPDQLPFNRWRESADWFFNRRLASGPFKIGSWTPQQEMVLLRNERYREKGRPYLDRVVLRFVPDASSLLTQFLNGDLDFIVQVSPSDADRIGERPEDLRLVTFWSNLYVVVAWNNSKPLFADPEIRRALTLAINRQEIVDTLLPGGTGRVGVSPIIQAVEWARNPKLGPLLYDPEEAKRILAAKGWRDTDGDGLLDRQGAKFAFELTSNAGNQVRNDAAVMIQHHLQRVGIAATPRILEFNTLLTEASAGQFDGTILGIVLDTTLDLSGNYHSRSIADGDNYFRYANPEVDRLIDEAARQKGMAAAVPLLRQIERQIYRDQPATFLWESKRIVALNRRVHGPDPNIQAGLFDLKDWWVDPRP